MFVTCEKKKIFASMLVCLFVHTVVLGGWKSLKTCRNAKKKKIFFWGGGGGVGNHFGGVGNHLKHVEMQKKKTFFCLFVCLFVAVFLWLG